MKDFQDFFIKTRKRMIACIVFLLCCIALAFLESCGNSGLNNVSGKTSIENKNVEDNKNAEDNISLDLSYDGYEYYLSSLTEKECEIASEENSFPDFGGQYKKLMRRKDKDGKEELIWRYIYYSEEMDNYFPPQIVGDRIILYGCKSDEEGQVTLDDLKSGCYVSVKMDGSSPVYLDTSETGSYDGLYCDGDRIYFSEWHQEGEYPHYINSMKNDFTDNHTVTSVNGEIIGVRDGKLYYLSTKKDQKGVYSMNLSDSSEQKIQDCKWRAVYKVKNKEEGYMDLKGYFVRKAQWTQEDEEILCKVTLEHATETMPDGSLKTKTLTIKLQ